MFGALFLALDGPVLGRIGSIITMNPAPYFAGSFIALGLFPIAYTADRDFQRAAWFYERDVLKEAIQEHKDEMNLKD